MKKDIIIYTDGACKNNPGPGGYAAIIAYDNDVITSDESIMKIIVDGSSNTTNNIMEIMAITKSLEYVKEIITNPKNENKYNKDNVLNIKLYSDSEYCIKGITLWGSGWISKNFKGVKNEELWRSLLTLVNKINNIEGINLEFLKVKGHSGNKYNDMVDKLPSDEAIKFGNSANNNIDTTIDFEI